MRGPGAGRTRWGALPPLFLFSIFVSNPSPPPCAGLHACAAIVPQLIRRDTQGRMEEPTATMSIDKSSMDKPPADPPSKDHPSTGAPPPASDPSRVAQWL